MSEIEANYIPHIELLIVEERKEIGRLREQISAWEEMIRANFFQMGKNAEVIEQNTRTSAHEIKMRDYWWDKESLVLSDFQSAQKSLKWKSLIQKHELNLDHRSLLIEKLCQDAILELALKYKETGIQHDLAVASKNGENKRVSEMNAKLNAENTHLRERISNAHLSEIEPLQDGLLFLKEFIVIIKSQQASSDTIHSWAEGFVKKYPSIPSRVLHSFQKLVKNS